MSYRPPALAAAETAARALAAPPIPEGFQTAEYTVQLEGSALRHRPNSNRRDLSDVGRPGESALPARPGSPFAERDRPAPADASPHQLGCGAADRAPIPPGERCRQLG